MTPQNNSAISQQTWDALNAHDIEKFKELLAEDCVYQSDVLPEPVRGRDAIGGLMQMYIGAFPDLRFTVERMHESGDHVITEWHGVGTHKGEFMGIAPTGRRGPGVRGCTVVKITNGRIVEDRVYWDSGVLLRQLQQG